ncbi:pyridoxamine 5'-phosphate oxidase family protein [Desulfosediminicola flagellatus]|uniref:pyridoxamine 5'-phosphate oxidase family protein n=1 Tax=Desulfosediminicola flagellatus TaxID=2569541 RepID=UPI0010ABEFDB|nr:pyridoxamine 5'-phosphate oxidase family protein [Desulfosediminicola flagellatus]
MLTEKFLDVISHEGVVAIVSCADNEAHVVNTWNSYLHITEDERILLPAWSMRKTEKKVIKNDTILLTVGSKEVEGKMGPGTGFLVKGTARFISSGPEWDMMKENFSFLTRVLEVTVESIKQTV